MDKVSLVNDDAVDARGELRLMHRQSPPRSIGRLTELGLNEHQSKLAIADAINEMWDILQCLLGYLGRRYA